MTQPKAEKTAFIGHPTDIDNFRSYIHFLKPEKTYSNEFLIKLFEWSPSYKIKEFSQLGFASDHGVDAALIMVPFLPEMRDISMKGVIQKIDAALGIASQAGCTVAAMGGFTSIVLQGQEKNFAEKHRIKITSGNSLTAAIIIRSIESVAVKFGIDLAKTTLAIIGASGDIGSACMGYLSTKVQKLYVTGRSLPALKEAVDRHRQYMTCDVAMTVNNREAIENSGICIFVTSAYDYLFSVGDFKPVTIVCDASAPLNVKADGTLRDDVFLYHGGVASVPFPIDAGFNIGIPSPQTFYGCQLEGLFLSLYPELPCSWGRGNITRDKLSLFLKKLDACESMKIAFSIGNTMYSDEQMDEYAGRWRQF
jgi:fatty aldehyde-generating acyl-ACP reductase